MSLEEKKQIYLDRFPAIIGKRMAEQFVSGSTNLSQLSTSDLIGYFNTWEDTNEGFKFWNDIHLLYFNNSEIAHQQLLDIFHKHNIKP